MFKYYFYWDEFIGFNIVVIEIDMLMKLFESGFKLRISLLKI